MLKRLKIKTIFASLMPCNFAFFSVILDKDPGSHQSLVTACSDPAFLQDDRGKMQDDKVIVLDNINIFSKMKVFLFNFIFLIIISFNNIDAADSEKDPITNIEQISFSNSNFTSLATTPPCMLDATKMAIMIGGFAGGLVSIGGGVSSIIGGNSLLAIPDPTFWSKFMGTTAIIGGGIAITTGVGGIVYSMMNAAAYGRCIHSFVRDPVEYYPDFFPDGHQDKGKGLEGKMKMVVKDSKGRTVGFTKVEGTKYTGMGVTDLDCDEENKCYFRGMPATSSDKLTVCARGMFPSGLFSMEGCYKKTSNTGIIPATFVDIFGEDGQKTFKNHPYYNGPTSMLCPEEFRNVGRMPEANADSTGFIRLKCTETNPNDCPKGTMFESFKGSGDIERYKLVFDRPKCETGVVGDTISLYGYKYKIIQKGTKICARLSGVAFGIPGPSYEIGCIAKQNLNIIPKCARSVPIFEDFKFDPDTGLLLDNGSHGKVIKYDDSPCYNKCAVSQMCTVMVKGLFQAPIPITSYLMGCIKESVGNVVFGCNSLSLSINNPTHTSNDSGMLYAIQKRVRPIIILMMTLSIILFGMQLLFFDAPPKTSEVMAYLLKIAFVFYLTATYHGQSGMTKYAQYIEKISAELQSYVLNSKSQSTIAGQAGVGNGKICDYSGVSYIKDWPGANGTTIKKDFSYLRVWDILDCHFINYLQRGVATNIVASGSNVIMNNTFDSNIFHIIITSVNMFFKYIILVIGMFLFAIFLLFVIIQVVELMILATLGFYILVLLSPIFVPFILFKTQKQIFDTWLAQIITYSLYPVILFAFMGFMFLVVDNIAFGQTRFVQVDSNVMGNKTKVFVVSDSQDFTSTDDGRAACNGFIVSSSHASMNDGDIPNGCDCNAVMCMMNAMVIKIKDNKSIFGPSASSEIKAADEATRRFQIGVLGMMFTMFIMYHFSKIMPSIVQALSGSTKALMSAGRNIRGANSRMEGLGKMAAGLVSGDDKKGGDEGDKKAARGSVGVRK